MRGLALLSFALVLTGCSPYDGVAPPPLPSTAPVSPGASVSPGSPVGLGLPVAPADAFTASVLRVVDGDTLVARRSGGALQRVRIIGIDAPESVRPGTPVQCFGLEAAAALRRLLPRGMRIAAAYQGRPHQDRFGRELWDVWLADGSFLAGRLVLAGDVRARAYRPQHRYADALERGEAAARLVRLGLHAACEPQQ